MPRDWVNQTVISFNSRKKSDVFLSLFCRWGNWHIQKMLRNLFKVIQNMLNSYFYKVTRLGGGLVTKSCPTLGTCQGCQAPLSMGFSRQEYWNGLQFPSLGDLPNPGIKPGSPALQADSLLTELQRKPPDYRHRKTKQYNPKSDLGAPRKGIDLDVRIRGNFQGKLRHFEGWDCVNQAKKQEKNVYKNTGKEVQGGIAQSDNHKWLMQLAAN